MNIFKNFYLKIKEANKYQYNRGDQYYDICHAVQYCDTREMENEIYINNDGEAWIVNKVRKKAP